MSKHGIEVIILAGGLGTRLKSELDGLPKCMANVNRLPFLKYLLDYLASFNVEHVIMSVGYRRGCIHRWIDEHYEDYPFDIDFAVENDPLGTGGGLLLAMTYLRRDKVIVMNGDTFFNIDLEDFYENAEMINAPISIALKPMRHFSRYTNVILDSSPDEYSGFRIKSFEPKKFCQEGYIKGGIYYIDRAKMDVNKYPEICSLEDDMLTTYVSKGMINGLIYNNYFVDIGVPKDYYKARREVPEVFTYMQLVTLDFSEYDTLILSRDGVINRLHRKTVVKSKKDFEFIPGFLDLIQIVSPMFKNVIIITNQSDIAKGRMSTEDLENIHKYMVSKIEDMHGKINAIYVCSAKSSDNPYRKPNIGMFNQACIDFPTISSEKTVMIGCSKADNEFAANSGIDYLEVNFRSYK